MVSLAAGGKFCCFVCCNRFLRLSRGFPDLLSGSLIAWGRFQPFAGVLSLCALLALLLVAMRERGIASPSDGSAGTWHDVAVFRVARVAGNALLPRLDISASIGLLRAQWLLQTSSLCVFGAADFGGVAASHPSRLHKIGVCFC